MYYGLIEVVQFMDCKVTLFKSGQVFDETMVASDYEDARRVALSRNPGATIVHVTATSPNSEPYFQQVDDFSGQSSFAGSSEEGIGFGSIFALLIVCGAFVIFALYMPVVVMVVFGIFGYWFGKKFGNILFTLLLVFGLSFCGFNLGTDWSNQINGSTPDFTDAEGVKTPQKDPLFDQSQPVDSAFEDPYRRDTIELDNCAIWRRTFPTAASRLKPGDTCYD